MSTESLRHLIFLKLWNKLKDDYEAQKPLKIEEEPFIEEVSYKIEWKYNPNYGDHRLCKCGHEYHRHFDSYDKMRNVGCKYAYKCNCEEFEEMKY